MTAEKLQFTEKGRGTPIVLLHGYPLNSTIWAEQQLVLGDHYRVITPDLRGFGKSPVTDGVYQMDLLARDLIALLDQLELEKVVLMGHSMGGYVTLAAARYAPERFSALGFICSQAGADSEETRQNRLKQANDVMVSGSDLIAGIMLPKLFAPELYEHDEEAVIEQAHAIMLATRPLAIYGTLRGMANRPDSFDLLPELTMPVLVLTTDKDQLIPAEKSESMAEALPNATLVIVEDAGHMPMLEQPRATAAAIRTFLTEVGL